jgi:hypothetical protein
LRTYLRDGKPFGAQAPPAALFHYSSDRIGGHPRRHVAGYPVFCKRQDRRQNDITTVWECCLWA